jgi:hypothetical protein
MPRPIAPSPSPPAPPPLPPHAGRYELTEAGDGWNRIDEDAQSADAVVVVEVIEPAEPPQLALPPAPQPED